MTGIWICFAALIGMFLWLAFNPDDEDYVYKHMRNILMMWIVIALVFWGGILLVTSL